MADAWKQIDKYLQDLGVRIGAPTPGQTTGGMHAPGSWHYSGHARDYGQQYSDMTAIIAALMPHAVNGNLVELFGLGTYWKEGRAIDPSPGLFDAHQDHVHAAIRPGATLSAPQEEETMEVHVVAAFQYEGGYVLVMNTGAVYAFNCTYRGSLVITGPNVTAIIAQ